MKMKYDLKLKDFKNHRLSFFYISKYKKNILLNLPFTTAKTRMSRKPFNESSKSNVPVFSIFLKSKNHFHKMQSTLNIAHE